MTKKLVVKQVEDAQVPTEVLAEAIVDISRGMKALRNGRLTNRALHLLIQDAAPGHVSLAMIRAVLEGVESLESVHVKKQVGR